MTIKPVSEQAPARVQHVQYWRGIVLRGAQYNADGNSQLHTVLRACHRGLVPSIQLQQHWEQQNTNKST